MGFAIKKTYITRPLQSIKHAVNYTLHTHTKTWNTVMQSYFVCWKVGKARKMKKTNKLTSHNRFTM